MKVSNDDASSVIPRKIIKLSREELQAADSDTLVEKVLSLTDQLSQVTEVAKKLKTREAQARLQFIQKDKELKDLIRERNDAYYSGVSMGPTQRDQLLDPFFYEAFISMKEKIASKDKEITALKESVKALESGKDWFRERNDAYYSGVSMGPTQRDQLLDPFFYEAFISMKEKIASKDKEITALKESVKALESGKDCKILYQFLESKNAAVKKLRECDKNARKIGHLENRLALAHAALRAIRKEKKDHAHEIAERDAKIAELEKELFNLRNEMAEEAISEHTELEPEEEVKADAETDAEADQVEQKPVVEDEDDDVGSGVDVDVSILHRSGEDDVIEQESTGSEERCVSVGENGVLKITV
ncbi:hypothetical protein OSTOST_02084 [Ostertagia ostertagi]